MRFAIALFLSVMVLPANASDDGKLRPLSESEYMLILRCSQAAHIAVYVAGMIPDAGDRMKFAIDIQKDPQLSKKLGKGTPTVAELISTTLAVGALLMEGASTNTAQAHDTLVGQAAAACALQARQ